MTLRQRIRFYEQLAMLMRAGMPVRAGFERLRERMQAPEIDLLAQKLGEGEKLGDAFAAAGFAPRECHLVVAGERSARLDSVFDHLAELFRRDLALRQGLIQPLYYPIFVMHLAILIGTLAELITTSWPVVMLDLVARFIGLYVIGALIFFGVRASWTSTVGRNFLRHVPIIGGSLKAAAAYRWISALKYEFVAGVSLLSAVGDAWRAAEEPDSEQLAAESADALRSGTKLSELMRQSGRFPRDWPDFIETGELSGQLETAFDNLELQARSDWSQAQQLMTEWVPKIAYFAALLLAAAMVFHVVYQVYFKPIIQLENTNWTP